MKKLDMKQIKKDTILCGNNKAFPQVIEFHRSLRDKFRNLHTGYSYIPGGGYSLDWINPDNTLAMPRIINCHFFAPNEYIFDYIGGSTSLSFFYHFDSTLKNIPAYRNGIFVALSELIFLYIPIPNANIPLKCFSRLINYNGSHKVKAYGLPELSVFHQLSFKEPDKLYIKELGVYPNFNDLIDALIFEAMFLFLK